jgi:hypothetical protein
MSIAWTKCSDSLPDEEIVVRVITEDDEALSAYHCIGAWWEPGDTADEQVLGVTHWAYLPDHPDYPEAS